MQGVVEISDEVGIFSRLHLLNSSLDCDEIITRDKSIPMDRTHGDMLHKMTYVANDIP